MDRPESGLGLMAGYAISRVGFPITLSQTFLACYLISYKRKDTVQYSVEHLQ